MSGDLINNMQIRSLGSRGYALNATDEPEKALALFEEFLDRVTIPAEPSLRLEIARSLIGRGNSLNALDRHKEALASFNEVSRYVGKSSNPLFRQTKAYGLAGTAFTLKVIGNYNEALAVFDELLRFCADRAATNPVMQRPLAMAVVGRLQSLIAASRYPDALVAFDETLKRFGSATDPMLRQLIARSFIGKGQALTALCRYDDAIAAYDEVPRLVDGLDGIMTPRTLVNSLGWKGAVYYFAGNHEKALAIFHDLVRRFGTAHDRHIRQQVGYALLSEGNMLTILGRYQEALEVCDQVPQIVGSLQGRTSLRIIYGALLQKATAWTALGCYEQALAAYDKVICRVGSSTADRETLSIIGGVLINKGYVLATIGNYEMANAAYDEVISRIGSTTDPSLENLVAAASLFKGIMLTAKGNPTGALEIFDAFVKLPLAEALPTHKLAINYNPPIIPAPEEFEFDEDTVDFSLYCYNELTRHDNDWVISTDYRTTDLSGKKMDKAALDLNAAADGLGLSKERAFEALKREAAELQRETMGRAKEVPHSPGASKSEPAAAHSGNAREGSLRGEDFERQSQPSAADIEAAEVKDSTLVRQWHKYNQLLTRVVLPPEGRFKTPEDARLGRNLENTYFRARERQAQLGIQLIPENDEHIKKVASAASAFYQKRKSAAPLPG